MKRITLLLTALATLVSLSACGSDDSDEAGSDGRNETDVTFAQDMIPHHAQAVEMSDLLLAKEGVDPRVAALAEQIKQAQAPEIETMSGWLEDWGEDVPPTTGMEDMGMDGMMSSEDMAELEAAPGEEASRLFLEQMTEHHSGAIDMAEVEIAEGSYPDAISSGEHRRDPAGRDRQDGSAAGPHLIADRGEAALASPRAIQSSTAAPQTPRPPSVQPIGPDAFATAVVDPQLVVINVHTPDESSIRGTERLISFAELERKSQMGPTSCPPTRPSWRSTAGLAT